MTEMHERLWHEWYDLWHEADASASKPSYEDWLESRIEALENRRKGLIAEIEVYRKQLARIRDRTTDPWAQQVARDGLHQGEEAALAAEEPDASAS